MSKQRLEEDGRPKTTNDAIVAIIRANTCIATFIRQQRQPTVKILCSQLNVLTRDRNCYRRWFDLLVILYIICKISYYDIYLVNTIYDMNDMKFLSIEGIRLIINVSSPYLIWCSAKSFWWKHFYEISD